GEGTLKKKPQRALSWCDSGGRVPRSASRDDAAYFCGSRGRRVTDRDQKASKMAGAGHKSGEDNLDVMTMMQIQRASSTALLLLLLLLHPLYAAESRHTKAVLVLYSEDKAHPAHELTDQGIRAAFRSNQLVDVHLYAEYGDLSRFRGPDHTRALADYFHRKYAGSKMDAIIAVYPAAVNVLLGEARAAFPGVPVVACEVSRSYAESLNSSSSRSFVTGVVMGDNMAGMLEAALRMRPDTR